MRSLWEGEDDDEQEGEGEEEVFVGQHMMLELVVLFAKVSERHRFSCRFSCWLLLCWSALLGEMNWRPGYGRGKFLNLKAHLRDARVIMFLDSLELGFLGLGLELAEKVGQLSSYGHNYRRVAKWDNQRKG